MHSEKYSSPWAFRTDSVIYELHLIVHLNVHKSTLKVLLM